jgi:hypothetical protein
MQWFDWFEAIVAHVCFSRRHEAPSREHVALLPPKMSVIGKTPNRTEKAGVWAAKNLPIAPRLSFWRGVSECR